MYIYNVTINVQEEVHDQWVKWMREQYIPRMLQTGKFVKALMTRVMVNEEMGGITYSIQYTALSKQILQKYYQENAQELESGTTPFEGKTVAFKTELQVISEQ